MAGDSFRSARAGEPVGNRVADRRWFDKVTKTAASDDTTPTNEPDAIRRLRPGVALLSNQHGSDVAQFGVLEVGGSVADPDTAPRLFNDPRNLLIGVTPTGAGQVAIANVTLLASGHPGEAVLLGSVSCDVEITSATHEYAQAIPGDVTKLTSASDGAVRILAKPEGLGVKRCRVLLGAGGGSGSAIRPGFIGEDDVDADGGEGSGDVSQTGNLVTTADLYDWLGHPPIDPLPDSFDNPRKLYYDAGDRLFIIAGGYEAWQPETPYVAGDERYATGADSQQRIWTRNDNGTSGTEFDATEESEWTEGELYTPSGWMLGGVLEKGVEGVNEGSEGEVVWLTEELVAAEEIRWSDLSQAEKDEFPQGVQDAYDANPNNTLLVPGTAEGERLRQVSKDALAFEPVYYREDGGGETVIVVNTVKQGLVGDQYVQLKSIQTDVATGVTFGLLDVAQCNNPISGS